MQRLLDAAGGDGLRLEPGATRPTGGSLSRSPEATALRRWVRAFEPYGREALVRIALAATEPTLPWWEEPPVEPEVSHDLLDALARFDVMPPAIQVASVRAWLEDPSEDRALAAASTLDWRRTMKGDLLRDATFAYLWEEPYVFALAAAVECVEALSGEAPVRHAHRCAVAVLEASIRAGVDAPLGAVVTSIREALGAWLAAG